MAPVACHSEKPAEISRRIEELYGPVRRVELFARTAVPGWVCLGNEVGGRDIRDALGTAAWEQEGQSRPEMLREEQAGPSWAAKTPPRSARP
jgi:hypothetical protein